MSSQLLVKLEQGNNPSITTASLVGELDETNMEVLKEQLTPVITNEEIKTLILNLPELTFINSKGIGFLVSIYTHFAKQKRKIVLVNASEPVMDVISLVGLTSIIPYYQTLDGANASL